MTRNSNAPKSPRAPAGDTDTPAAAAGGASTRRGFIGSGSRLAVGGALASAGVAQATTPSGGADPAGLPSLDGLRERGGDANRQLLRRTLRVRVERAKANFDAGVPRHRSNGDEERYPNKIGSDTRGLPHDARGEVDLRAWATLQRALRTQDPADFERITLGGTRKLVNPLGTLAVNLTGLATPQIALPPAPVLSGAERAAEAVEVYWQSLLRYRFRQAACRCFGPGRAAPCLPGRGVAASSRFGYPDPRSVRGRVVLITDGSRGLGAAIADELGAAGAHIGIGDVAVERAAQKAQELGQRGIQALAVPLDVGDDRDAERAVQAVLQRWGRLDVLVNNAVIDLTLPIASLSAAQWDRILQTNLSGAFFMIRHAVAAMARRPGPLRGHVVNIAATASRRVWPNAAPYHATTWGLLGLSHALHAELRGQGIVVCAVVAGGMRTPFLLDSFAEVGPAVLQEPSGIAQAVHFVLTQPVGTVVPELTVLSQQEALWP